MRNLASIQEGMWLGIGHAHSRRKGERDGGDTLCVMWGGWEDVAQQMKKTKTLKLIQKVCVSFLLFGL